MVAMRPSRSAAVRARLDHPIIDLDGHTQEFPPVIADYVREIGGGELAARYRAINQRERVPGSQGWFDMTPAERRDNWVTAAPWWGAPTRNSLDRASAHLPRVLHERMDELGLDFTVLYPTHGIMLPRLQDAELRQVACRAVNAYHADVYRDYADRMTPAAVIPMHTPEEAIAELEYAVNVLGLKAVMIGHVMRPVPRIARERPDLARFAERLDPLGLDSDYDYDPFWAKCLALKVAPASHSSGQGWGSRRSISNHIYNHIGHFAAAGEAICKALFLGGVTYRFPELKVAFLEGGVSWACSLYADLISHWEKRNLDALPNLDPANLDLDLVMRLVREYGHRRVAAKAEELRAFFQRPLPRPEDLDEWAACGIRRVEDIYDRFIPHFYFGCEADDPLNAWAFNTKVNPLGARLNIILGSDIGHWDVTDMADVVAEAYELVEREVMSPEDFRDFTFTNAVRFYAGTNPEFFKGTRCEAAVAAWLEAQARGDATGRFAP